MDASTIFWLVILILIASVLLSSEDTPAQDSLDELHKISDEAYHEAQSLSEEFLQMAINQLNKKRR
jgi:hypothetical protein